MVKALLKTLKTILMAVALLFILALGFRVVLATGLTWLIAATNKHQQRTVKPATQIAAQLRACFAGR